MTPEILPQNPEEAKTIKETKGNNYDVPCPHCGVANHYVCDTLTKWLEEQYTEFWKPCCAPDCKKEVYYKAKKSKDDGGFPAIEITAYSDYLDRGFGI